MSPPLFNCSSIYCSCRGKEGYDRQTGRHSQVCPHLHCREAGGAPGLPATPSQPLPAVELRGERRENSDLQIDTSKMYSSSQILKLESKIWSFLHLSLRSILDDNNWQLPTFTSVTSMQLCGLPSRPFWSITVLAAFATAWCRVSLPTWFSLRELRALFCLLVPNASIKESTWRGDLT